MSNFKGAFPSQIKIQLTLKKKPEHVYHHAAL